MGQSSAHHPYMCCDSTQPGQGNCCSNHSSDVDARLGSLGDFGKLLRHASHEAFLCFVMGLTRDAYLLSSSFKQLGLSMGSSNSWLKMAASCLRLEHPHICTDHMSCCQDSWYTRGTWILNQDFRDLNQDLRDLANLTRTQLPVSLLASEV